MMHPKCKSSELLHNGDTPPVGLDSTHLPPHGGSGRPPRSSRSRERLRLSLLNCTSSNSKSPTSPPYGSNLETSPKQRRSTRSKLESRSKLEQSRSVESDVQNCSSDSVLETDSVDRSRDRMDRSRDRNDSPKEGVNGEFSPAEVRRPIWKSLSTFSLRSLSFRSRSRKNKDSDDSATDSGSCGGGTMERARTLIGGSVPGDGRFNLASVELAELSRSAVTPDASSSRRRKSTEIPCEKTEIVYGTLRRRNTGRRPTHSPDGRLPPVPLFRRKNKTSRRKSSTSSGEAPLSAVSAPSSPFPGVTETVRLVRILKLNEYLLNRWITGLSVTERGDLIIVDLRAAYLVDLSGNLIRMIGSKGPHRLVEPICAAACPEGNLIALSDHADLSVKLFTTKGTHVLTESELNLKNVAGLTFARSSAELLIAGVDRKNIILYRTDGSSQLETFPSNGCVSPFRHPYSVAYNTVSNEVIVGDDCSQSVIALSLKTSRVVWTFKPDECHAPSRQFFPSALCCDKQGYVFVADLYNERVYMLDAVGNFICTLLSRDEGLRGNPGAMATDGKGNLYVADEEKTVKVFRYNVPEVGGVMGGEKRRFTFCSDEHEY